MKLVLNSAANQTSYGYTSCYFFRELVRNGVEVEYFPIGPVVPELKFMNELGGKLNQDQLLSPKTNCLKIWHQHDLASFIGNGKHIGFPIFELDTFTAREKAHLSSCDLLIVCSQWAKQIVESQVNVPVEVVPLGYDDDVFKSADSKKNREGGPYIFANFGKWEIRKGHDVLLQAFNQSFNEDDNVELWLFPHNQHLTEQQRISWQNYYLKSKLGSKIKIYPRLQTQTDLYGFMKEIDCAVFPTRAEGWNLEALECLACGKEVIATNYSGQTEFLTPQNSFLISPNGMETAYDGVFFSGQGNWMKWSKDLLNELCDKMRDRYKSGSYLNTAGINDAKQFTWESSGRKLIEVLKRHE